MTEKVTEYTGSPWSRESIERLVQLWNEGVKAELVSQALHRPEAEVRAKAAMLGLTQHVDAGS